MISIFLNIFTNKQNSYNSMTEIVTKKNKFMIIITRNILSTLDSIILSLAFNSFIQLIYLILNSHFVFCWFYQFLPEETKLCQPGAYNFFAVKGFLAIDVVSLLGFTQCFSCFRLSQYIHLSSPVRLCALPVCALQDTLLPLAQCLWHPDLHSKSFPLCANDQKLSFATPLIVRQVLLRLTRIFEQCLQILMPTS